MGAAVAIPAVIGALGLYQANQQSNSQRNAQNAALNASKTANAPITEALQNMLDMAKTHDFHQDTINSVANAQEVGAATLQKALGNLNGQYRAGGGVPGNSSEFNVKALQTSRGVLDPLSIWTADQNQNEFARRLSAFQAVNGGNTGSLSSDYWKYASSLPQPNYSGGMTLLNQALNNFVTRQGGAGGSGDSRSNMSLYPNNSPYPNPPAGSRYVQNSDGSWVAVPTGGS